MKDVHAVIRASNLSLLRAPKIPQVKEMPTVNTTFTQTFQIPISRMMIVKFHELFVHIKGHKFAVHLKMFVIIFLLKILMKCLS